MNRTPDLQQKNDNGIDIGGASFAKITGTLMIIGSLLTACVNKAPTAVENQNFEEEFRPLSPEEMAAVEAEKERVRLAQLDPIFENLQKKIPDNATIENLPDGQKISFLMDSGVSVAITKHETKIMMELIAKDSETDDEFDPSVYVSLQDLLKGIIQDGGYYNTIHPGGIVPEECWMFETNFGGDGTLMGNPNGAGLEIIRVRF